MKKTLFLILKKQWFDLILSGEKKEEYRDITEYWIKRLFVNHREYFTLLKKGSQSLQFTHICFQHGYANDAPRFEIECKGIKIATGKKKWGAEKGKKYFVIKLGKIISVTNFKAGQVISVS